MPYLSKYRHDVFVSYAHGPSSPIDLLGDWSRRLVRHLQSELNHRMGTKDPDRRVSIWMDRRLAGNQPITEEIRDTAQRSALFLVIMSRYFFETSWCSDEVEWFSEVAARHGGRRDRIFVVRAEPTTESRWPSTLRDSNGHVLPGYRFHTPSSDFDEAETLGWHSSAELPTDPEYSQAVTRLAKDIGRQLKRLEESNGNALAVPPPAGQTVFLGLMHDTIEEREELRASLTAAGLIVIPSEADDPVGESSLREAFESQLPQADAMVLAANKYPGVWPKGEAAGFISLQVQEARKRNLPCYLWLQTADAKDIKHPKYREYLESLQADPAALPVALCRADLPSFVTHVMDGLSKAKIGRVDDLEEEKTAVICANQPADASIGRQLEDAVHEVLLEVSLDYHDFKFSDPRSEQIKLENLRKRIRAAPALLVLCYDQEWRWASMLLRELHQLTPLRSESKAKLLIAGPKDRQEGIYNAHTLGFRTIDGINLDIQRLKESLREAIGASMPPIAPNSSVKIRDTMPS